MNLNPHALAVKVDDAALCSHAFVQRYAIAAAHTAISTLYPGPHAAACPSDYTDATDPANKLVAAMSDILMQVRRETLREVAHTVGGMS